jgi:hypothetical protein
MGEKKNAVAGFLRDILTEDNEGQIFDYVRVLSIVGALVLMGLAVWSAVMIPTEFDIAAVGRSFMEYLVGVGVAIFGKGKSGE